MAATKKPAKKTVSTAAKPALKTAKPAAKTTKKAQSSSAAEHKDIVKTEVVVITILAAIFLVLAIIKYT